MVSFKKIKLWVLLVLSVGIIVNICLIRLGQSYPLDVRPTEIGKPLIHQTENTLICSEISSIVATESYVYLLYKDADVVQVYRSDGAYLATIAIYDPYENGSYKITLLENEIVLTDKIGNIYIFMGTKMTAFYEKENVPGVIKQQSTPENTQYFIRKSSVVTQEESGISVFVHRPNWLIIYQNNFLYFLQFALVATIGLLAMKWAKRT